MTEHDIQKQIVEYLRLKNILVFNTDVMGGLQFFSHKDRRRFSFINHHKSMGYTKGQPDLIIAVQGSLVAVEIKKPKTYQSKEQKELQKQLEYQGIKYCVWRSLDDCINGLDL